MSLVDETGFATATSLEREAFYGLFKSSTSLTDASGLLLPATTLAEYCYQEMFSQCTSLTKAPVLPATTLVEYCYSNMFYRCTSLRSVTCLATDISAYGCTRYWLSGVDSEGTFTKAAGVEWESGDSGIPSGWSVKEKQAATSPFASVTADDLGKVIGADGNIYDDATAATTAGTTALAKICYVGDEGTADASSSTYKGLALALSDVSSTQKWCSLYTNNCLTTKYSSVSAAKTDMAGIANTDALVGHASHNHYAAKAARDYNGGTHPTGTSEWFLPSAGQWDKMATAVGGYATLKDNVNLREKYSYWSSSEGTSYNAWGPYSGYDSWDSDMSKIYDYSVRACLAF